MMRKIIFEKQVQEEEIKPLIKNTLIEKMFMTVCSDEQMQEYLEKASSKVPVIRASATAYASGIVEKYFNYWRDSFIKQGGSLEDLDYILWRKLS